MRVLMPECATRAIVTTARPCLELRDTMVVEKVISRVRATTLLECCGGCDGMRNYWELSRRAQSVVWNWRGNASDLCFAGMRSECEVLTN